MGYQANRDNELLGPTAGGCIGRVDEVNGPGAAEVAEFVPTRYELEHLFTYWADRMTDLDYFMFVYNQWGSDWSRISLFASRRVHRIACILGDEVCQALWDKVEAHFAKAGGELWRAFKEGDSATRDRYLDQSMEIVNRNTEGACIASDPKPGARVDRAVSTSLRVRRER